MLRLAIAALLGLGTAAKADEIKGASWFADAWPVNFWNVDLVAKSKRDFPQIKQDGFNTVVLIVPWLGFVDPLNTGRVVDAEFRRLDAVIANAEELGLSVVMRVGYSWNSGYPQNEQLNISLYSNEAVYQSWLAYMAEVGRRYNSRKSVTLSLITWEDLFIVTHASHFDEASRLGFARESGFQDYLSREKSLSEVSGLFGRDLASWSDVPIPDRHSPAYSLYLDYVKDRFINRFYIPASKLITRFSAEVRVDRDPIFNGQAMIGTYDWSDIWDLPGAEWVTLYFNPYYGAENKGKAIPPAIVDRNFRYMIDNVRSKIAPGKKLFVDQLNWRDNTPGFVHDYMRDEDLPSYLAMTAATISQKMEGYAVWFYGSYRHNAIANPQFFRGAAGWSHGGGVEFKDSGAYLAAGSFVETEVVAREFHAGGPSDPATLSITGIGDAVLTITNGETSEIISRLQIRDGAEKHVIMQVRDGMKLRISPDKPFKITNVTLSKFAQEGTIYDLAGAPAFLRDHVRSFNAALWSTSDLGIERDGWMGARASGYVTVPSGMRAIEITTFLPDDWPHEPNLTIRVAGASSEHLCRKGRHVIRIPVPATGRKLPIEMTTQDAKSPKEMGIGPDIRPIACIIHELKVLP